jgi:hypothetical protein
VEELLARGELPRARQSGEGVELAWSEAGEEREPGEELALLRGADGQV